MSRNVSAAGLETAYYEMISYIFLYIYIIYIMHTFIHAH